MKQSSSLIRFDELADALNGSVGFRESSDLEDVNHAWPDFECDVDAVSASHFGHSNGIVAQHFVFTTLNQKKLQASEVAWLLKLAAMVWRQFEVPV